MINSTATILIVDDEIQNRKLLDVLLRSEGYLTLHAASGEEALVAIAHRAPDLILLDIMMPGMDGYEVAKQLKATLATSNIPIIMVTAQIDSRVRLASLSAGAEEFLTKPVDRAELSLRVRNLLRLKTLGDRLQNHSAILEQEVQARTAELQRFRTAMDATADAIMLVNRTTMNFVEVNATACKMFGYTREEFFQMSPSKFIASTPEQLESEYDAIIAGHFSTAVREVQFWHKDGSPLHVEVRRHAERSGADWIIVGVVRDISERKRDQDALRELNAELEDRVRARTTELNLARDDAEQASRAKSAFLATMSHEIRTPLNGVIGMIDVLQQTSLRGDQVEMVDLIRDSAFSLLEIIEDILDLSKIEAGKANIQNEPLHLTAVVEKVCAMLDQTAVKRGSRISVFVDPAIPGTIAGDETRLRQVLVNLTGNAIKFSSGRDQPGKISVRAELVERQERVVIVDLIVADNGIGMDEAALGQLFTPFSQADVSTTRRYGGTGLGLAICALLVSLMDGEISVRSTPDQGSTFTVRLRFGVCEVLGVGDDTPPAAQGLRCRIVGVEAPLADDLATYLTHAGAIVERSPDLPAAAAAEHGEGLWVWLILPGPPMPTLAELRAMAPREPGVQTRFIALGRGRRRRPRVDAVDLVALDIDPLFRDSLCKALGLASGRVVVEPASREERQSAYMPVPQRHEARLQRRLILVAEDNETNRKVILRQLHLIGFAADIVVNGRDALESWRSGDFALLLTDLHMPEMDGYALAAAIRAEEGGGHHVPIIALTANALRDEGARCRAAGMDAYLTKPVRLEHLKAAIEARLGPPAHATTLRDAGPTPATAAPAVDLNVLVALVGDDPVVISEVLEIFGKSAAKSTSELSQEVMAGSVQAVAETAHKLKSAARSIGAIRLGEICADFEEMAERGRATELIASLPRFQVEMDSVNRFLDSR